MQKRLIHVYSRRENAKKWSGAPDSRKRHPSISMAARLAAQLLAQLTAQLVDPWHHQTAKKKKNVCREELPLLLRSENMEDTVCSRCLRKYSTAQRGAKRV